VAEQVIIEFIGDTTSLSEAANQINQLGQKESDSLKKTNGEYKNHTEQKKKLIDLEKQRQAELNKTIDTLSKETGQSKKELQEFAKVMTGVVGKSIQDITGQVNQYAGAVEKTTKAMANQAKEGQSLKARLKEIKAELSGMETGDIAFDPKRFKELSKEGGVLADAIGDVSARVNVLASDTQGLDAMISTAQGITGAFSIAQGAAALLGDENQELQEALLKVQSTMAILNGLQALQATLNKDSAFSVTVLGAAQSAYAAYIGTSTGALKLFKLALIATGIGAAIVLIGTLIASWDDISAAVLRSIKPLRDFSDSLGGIKGVFNGIVESFKSGFGQIGEIISAVSKGEFSKVVDLAKGLGTAFADGFNKGVKEEKANQAEEMRLQETRERIVTNERLLRVQEAAGKNTIALERKILQDKIAVQKEGTDEYKDAVTDLQVFEAKILNEKKANHKEEKDSYIRSIQEQTDAYLNELKRRQTDATRSIEIAILQERLGLNRKTELAKLERDLKKQNIDNSVTDLEKATLEKELIDKEYYANLTLIDDEYWAKQKEREDTYAKGKEEFNKKVIEDEKEVQKQIREATLNTFSSILGSFQQISQQNTQQKLDTLEEQRDAELANEELTESQKLAINKKYENEAKQLKRKAAEEDKALKLMQAIIGTAQAVINAYGSGGPAGIALAALVAAAGAAQIAVIARTPIPKFAKGTEFVERGNNPRGTDTIPAFINEGERIVPTEINRKLKGIPNSMLPELVKSFTQPMPRLEYQNITQLPNSNQIDYDRLGTILADKLKANPQAVVKIDKSGFSTYIQTRNSQVEYLNNKFNA
jgi:hypothetical protein